MPISLVLDIIISVLLVLTIAYAVRLNQRLSQLRSDKNELLKLAKTFADATSRAEAGIQQLKVSTDSLKSEVDKAMALKDDLSYLVDRGDRTADEMVANVRTPQRSDDTLRAASSQKPAPVGMGGLGMGPGSAGKAGSRNANGVSRNANSESRLIEEAIRAAHSAQPQEQERDQGRQGARGQSAPSQSPRPQSPRPQPARPQSPRLAAQDERNAVTRRISGHPSAPPASSGALATRGLGASEEEDSIEDTQAARALLKALSSVQ